MLFDKVATPGGDHCHFFRRMRAPLGREVYTIGNGMRFILERDWSKFSRRQVELLVAAGIPRAQAEGYYSANNKRIQPSPTFPWSRRALPLLLSKVGPSLTARGSGWWLGAVPAAHVAVSLLWILE